MKINEKTPSLAHFLKNTTRAPFDVAMHLATSLFRSISARLQSTRASGFHHFFPLQKVFPVTGIDPGVAPMISAFGAVTYLYCLQCDQIKIAKCV